MELTTTEQTRLIECETIIERGLKTFVEVGNALMDIRDKRLYRAEYSTFEDYCQERWGLTRRYVNYQISAAKTVDNLGTTVLKGDLPQTERQARPLMSLPPEEQAPVWIEALKTAPDGKVTAKHVKKVVDKHKETITLKKTHAIKNWYTISDWQALDADIKKILLSKSGNSIFNPTNDNIEWARYSWNPITGCLHNCTYCYARDIANRFYSQKFEPSFLPDRLTAPNNTKQKDLNQFDNPVDRIGYQNVFTCSMADLFGKWNPIEWIRAVLKSIEDNPQWTFLLLTKFPIRMAEFNYPNNVWLGTTVDYQWSVERAEKAFTKIKKSGFNGVCWLSCEPMMERLTFSSLNMFDWIVMGGSSKSTQTSEYKPPFEDIIHLHYQARRSGCKIYQKTNLIPGMDDDQRVREYPMEDE